jgi:choline dehydrogenase-like flavoprotein
MNDYADASVMVVGSGPVGLSVSLSLANLGHRVVLIEAGAMRPDRSNQADSDAEILDVSRHAAMPLAARRGFGGTSALWGGRAVPLDPIDLLQRDWVAHSGWPIAWEALAKWYPAACAFLDCGPAKFEDSGGEVSTALERWCAQPNIGAVKLQQVQSHRNIRAVSQSTVTQIVFDDAGTRAIALDLFSDGVATRIPIRACVVAAGGVETTRLLLNSSTERPGLFGGPDGALGRYYMGHIFGSIADIVFSGRGGDAGFDYAREASGHYFRRRMSLTDRDQNSSRLLNAAFWPEVPAIADARHRSAVLSMGYLALAAPGLGPRLAAPAIRARKLAGGDGRAWPHFANLLRDPIGAASFALGFGAARYLSRIRKPGFFPLNPARRYSLFHHGEHAPNPDSRITLASNRDNTGMLRARIDLRFGSQDADSIVRSAAALSEKLHRSGAARIEYLHPTLELTAAALSQASDGFHQIGGARMSEKPNEGVVDANSRVHGISNLFIAGSAIFPTSGQANPTLTAVALAARLADHLNRVLPSLPPVSGR